MPDSGVRHMWVHEVTDAKRLMRGKAQKPRGVRETMHWEPKNLGKRNVPSIISAIASREGSIRQCVWVFLRFIRTPTAALDP